MPVFLMLGIGLAVICAFWGVMNVLYYGTKRDVYIMVGAAWLIVIVLWAVQV